MQENEEIVPADLVCDELKPYKRLENVMKMWAVATVHEDEQEQYRKMKEYYA
mgnify:CR=1 FL=1